MTTKTPAQLVDDVKVLSDMINQKMMSLPDHRIFCTGTRITIHPANGHYSDPGLDHVAEFAKAFDAHIAVEPGVPAIDLHSVYHIRSFFEAADSLAKGLKVLAEAAKQRGDESGSLLLIRLQLCQEELSELAEAMARGDIVGCLDALVDMSYVGDGTYLSLGLGQYKLAAYEEVHRSNMSKLGDDGQPITSSAGRIVKGPNYSPPDLRTVLGFPTNEE